MESVRVNGIQICYHRVGEGPALLLVGGTGMPPIAWEVCGLRDALVANGFDVITYAARGVTPTDAPPAPYTVEQLAEDAAGLLDTLGVSSAALVGYSLGSFTVERLARTRPDLVHAAVLLAGAGPTSPLLASVVDTESSLIAATGRIPDSVARLQTLLTALPPDVLRDDDTVVQQWIDMLGMQSQMWTSIDGENGQSAANHSWLHDETRMAALSEVDIPVLVAAYEHDLYFPPRISRLAADALPHGQFVEIPGAAHAGLMTHPAPTTQVIIDFLSRTVRTIR